MLFDNTITKESPEDFNNCAHNWMQNDDFQSSYINMYDKEYFKMKYLP